MLEPVSFKDVMDSLSKRLNYGLKKARIFPELLASCETAARRLNALKTLKRVGAELYLASDIWGRPLRKFWVHPIPEEKRKIFVSWKKFGFHEHFALDRQLYANMQMTYGGKKVLVHLGEWKPFIEFTTNPLEMSLKEFTRVCREIQRYRASMRKYAENFEVAEERLRDGRPVFLFTGDITDIPEGYMPLACVRPYTEYSYACAELTEEDRAREEEERRAEEERLREQAMVFEKLIARGRLKGAAAGEDFVVFEVSPEDVERTLNIPVKGVAEKAYIVRMEYLSYREVDVRPSTQLSYLHALRYLRDAGVDASLVRCRYKEIKSGIQIREKFISPYFYAVIIVPKSVHRLPPIKLAKVIKSKKRIVVVES